METLSSSKIIAIKSKSRWDENQQWISQAIAKIAAGDGCNRVCQKALSIFGGYGLMDEYPAQRFLRDSYFPMIGGGTSDIMRLLVARQLGL